MLPIFIFDTDILDPLARNDRRPALILYWVRQLKRELKGRGLDLMVCHGRPEPVLQWIAGQHPVKRVLVTADYDAYAKERDRRVSRQLPLQEVHDTYLLQPESVATASGKPYRVFTPFYRAAVKAFAPRMTGERMVPPDLVLAGAVPDDMLDFRSGEPRTVPVDLASLGFGEEPSPDAPAMCNPEELLERFQPMLSDYDVKRDVPGLDHVSRLGPHLRFGTISVRQVMRWLDREEAAGVTVEPFRRQLYWREFYAHILHHFPASERENFQPLDIPWRKDPEALDRWCKGQTGVPLVDAGMRQLVQTGYMHNRARMVVSSFLVKDLHLDWREGEAVFARHLLDYDASANVGSWQWAASTGTDAQPYFRVFNPWRQGERFDADGGYIRRWVPELTNVAPKDLHNEGFFMSNQVGGYPKPVVMHREAAAAAVAMFKAAKERQQGD